MKFYSKEYEKEVYFYKMTETFGKFIIFLLKLVSRLPDFGIKTMTSILGWLTHSIIPYRKKVIQSNFERSFPDASKQEIKTYVKKYYYFLASLVMQSLQAFSLSKEQLEQKVKFINNDVLQPFVDAKQPFIVIIGHYGNWELMGLSGSFTPNVQFHSLYRTLENEPINQFVVQNRQRFGLKLIEEKQAIRQIPSILKEDACNALVFLADQATLPKRAFWFHFLNQDTTFVKGPELYAKKYNCPVLFGGLTRTEDGNYEAHYEIITTTPLQCEDGEIMSKYAQLLEQQIKNNPPYWLWSHKRWKHKRPVS